MIGMSGEHGSWTYTYQARAAAAGSMSASVVVLRAFLAHGDTALLGCERAPTSEPKQIRTVGRISKSTPWGVLKEAGWVSPEAVPPVPPSGPEAKR